MMSIVRAVRVARALGAAAGVSLLSIGGASAVTLSLSGSGAGLFTLPTGANSFNPTNIGAITGDGITAGSTQVTVFNTTHLGGLQVAPGDWTLSFTFMGKEASYTDLLRINGVTQYSNQGATPGVTTASLTIDNNTLNPERLPFSFRAVNPGNFNARNNGSIHSGLQIAFYQISDTVVYAFFDDGGAGPDHDFDDMVIKITASCSSVVRPCETTVNPTPLPAALPLFAGGLGVLGLLGWRRKRARKDAV